MASTSKKTNEGITVKTFLKDLQGFLFLEDLTKTPHGLSRKIRVSEFGQLGLLFLKYFKNVQKGQMYIIENDRRSYYSNLSFPEKDKFLASVQDLRIPTIIICGKRLPKREIDLFKKYHITLLYSAASRRETIQKVERYLNFVFAAKAHVHGVLMDIYGVGILIKGESGIGKSEVALELLADSHRLVADDLVVIHKQYEFLIGYGMNSPFSYHVEARGVGLIDVKTLFGVQSIRHKKRVEIIVEFVKGEDIDYQKFDRLRMDIQFERLLGIKIPKYTIPVTSSKNLANIIELIGLSHVANIMGENPINTINEKLSMKKKQGKKDLSYIDSFYFIADNE